MFTVLNRGDTNSVQFTINNSRSVPLSYKLRTREQSDSSTERVNKKTRNIEGSTLTLNQTYYEPDTIAD